MATKLSENAVFIQHHLPGLDTGEYAVEVKHKFESDNTDNDPNQTPQIPGGSEATAPLLYKFAVQGPRFRMDPGIVHSLFPPDGSLGEFSNVLPHVVLTNETLPWSLKPVTPDGKTDVDLGDFTAVGTEKYDLDVPTWLAVLILTETDFAAYTAQGYELKIDNTTTGTFFGPLNGDFISPALGEDVTNQPSWIKASDPCQAIKIPIALFSSIAPSLADLFMMANVRSVQMGSKPAQAVTDGEDMGTYSIVMGNRIPAVGQQHLAMLVSLENMQDYLPDQYGVASTKIPATVTYAYLPVLANWNFISAGDSYRFDHLLESLNNRAPHGNPVVPGPLPNARFKMYQPAGAIPATGAAAQAIELGYTPLKHTTRNTQVTASWYRGPLVPYAVQPGLQIFKTQQNAAVPAIYDADALVRLDPTTGLFDLSYASAWQLGRLLALQDKTFSINLYQWKRQTAGAAIQAMEEKIINEQFPETLQHNADNLDGDTAHTALLNSTLRQLTLRTKKQSS